MFDINKTVELIKGGLLEPRATWQSYLAENRGWQDTAVLLTLPLIIASFVLSGILSLIFWRYHMGFGRWLLSILSVLIGIAAASFIFSYLAGVFKGKHDFNRGLAALSLAAIPEFVGAVALPVPWIGRIVWLALLIVTFVYTYQIIPLYLEVPEDKRVLHYVSSLVVSAVAMMVVVYIIGQGAYMGMYRGGISMTGEQPAQVGMLGGIQRYADLMDRAQKDRYDPPADGKVTAAQMKDYMEVMRKTAEVQKEQMANVDKLQKQYKDKEPSAADLPALSGGFGSVLGAMSAEMEVVMTGKGNWAEHQWVKQQLHTARIQKDINETVKHNYALYQANAAELEQLAAIP